MGIINKIRSFFKTPNKVSIRKGFNNWFKFYNSNLANNETIFSAVTMKANAIASAPVSINLNYRKLSPKENNLAYLFKFGPNPRQTMFSFMQYMEATRNTSSGAYAIIEYSNVLGNVEAIWPLKSGFVEPVIDSDTNELYYEIRDHNSNELRFVHSDHIIALEYLDNNHLDDVTFNKAISKINDSYKVTREEKEMLRRKRR